jgi:bacteriocin biosynthesis cyclodehydratase domain-containing protein
MSSGYFSRVFRLHGHLRVAVWDASRVFLVGEEQQFLLTGEAYGLVVPHIDGQRTVAAIAAVLEGKLPPSEVVYALMMLEQRGYVTDAGDLPGTESDGFWSALGIDPLQARRNLGASSVSVHGPREEDVACLAGALERTGVRVADDGAVHVVLTDDYLSEDLERMHLRARRDGLRWMPVKARGPCPWVGPLFSPDGACWACLASRLRFNRPVETYVAQHGRERPVAPAVALAAGVEGAIQWSALALARWIASGSQGVLDASLLVIDAATLSTREHRVVKRPQCAGCGDPGLYTRRAEGPVHLASVPRRVSDDGGYRMQHPDDTLARLLHCVSPITGVVASLEPMPGRDDPLRPVYTATYRVCPIGDAPSPNDFHRYSAGKGRAAAQARASALCEALERQSAAFQGDEPRIMARLVDLGDDAVHPDRLQEFSAAQRASAGPKSETAQPGDARRLVPPPFDEQAAIEWTPAWSLTHERRRWLPLTYCYSQVPSRAALGCPFNPNGHAAGNCREEAVLQALLELVERDAVGIWWYNRVARPAVDLESFDEPYLIVLKKGYASLGWSLWVLDLTHDLRIPCFVALARAENDGRFSVGFGCHLDARLGVQRAMTELNQLFDPAAAQSPWGDEKVTSGDYLFPSSAPPSARADFDPPAARDLRDDVLACVARLGDAGLETLVIDQTRPDVDLSVVKVVVPGLRHIWPRLGPGRLYDVPVACGWLKHARAESELNPVPLFL